MTNLTDKFKKGELELGEHYYYTTIFSPIVHIQNFTRDVISFQDFKETVAEVLAPVPSYEQWQAKLEENARLKAIKEKTYNYDYLSEYYSKFTKENAQLKSKLQLKETAYDFDTARLEEENTKLKELLKECEHYLEYHIIREKHVGFTPQSANVLQEINQVLGEK